MRSLTLDKDALDPLLQIVKVDNGAVIFESNTGFDDLSFLESIEEIVNDSEAPALQIANNRGLVSLGMPNLKHITSKGTGPAVEIYADQPLPEDVQEHLKEITGDRFKFVLGEKAGVDQAPINNTLIGVIMIACGAAIFLIVLSVLAVIILKKHRVEKVKRAAIAAELSGDGPSGVLRASSELKAPNSADAPGLRASGEAASVEVRRKGSADSK